MLMSRLSTNVGWEEENKHLWRQKNKMITAPKLKIMEKCI